MHIAKANLLILQSNSQNKKDNMRKICFAFSFVFSFYFSPAQQETYNWYFGNHAALNFSGGSPVVLSNSAMATSEGCSSISDNAGNLLFYTDGVSVYNSNNAIMPNGSGLLGHESSTQSALIVKKPSSSNLYYIFTTDAGNYVDPPNNGLHFSEVDMTLDGGLGDIVAATKNTVLLDSASEKLCGVKNANGNDIWVMAHGWNDSTFYAYLVTAAGVNMTPVTTAIGAAHTGNDENSLGQMKFSPQGDHLALAVYYDGFYQLFDFNNSTAVVSNPLYFISQQHPISCYGVEFSPDGSRLYVNTLYFDSLYQYNLLAGSPAAILASATRIGSISAPTAGSMQLAPDGKIYVAQTNGSTSSGSPYLSRINSPNTLGIGCNYVNNAVNLGTGRSVYGLPCIVASYLTTGINTIDVENDFTIYYDGAEKKLKINFDAGVKEKTILKLMDIAGRAILSSEINSSAAEIILPTLKTGVYFVQLNCREINFYKKIFIY